MTQEEKELLLKVLCAMLPHGVKCHFKYGTSEGDIILRCIDGNIARFDYGWYGKFHVIIDPQYIKPYLRPMSSMTEEEAKDFIIASDKDMEILQNNLDLEPIKIVGERVIRTGFTYNETDWLNKHHFDYRGLIPMGLALEAPENMYG